MSDGSQHQSTPPPVPSALLDPFMRPEETECHFQEWTNAQPPSPDIVESIEEQRMKDFENCEDLPSPNYSPPPYSPTQASIKTQQEYGEGDYYYADWDEERNKEWNEEWDNHWYNERWWTEKRQLRTWQERKNCPHSPQKANSDPRSPSAPSKAAQLRTTTRRTPPVTIGLRTTKRGPRKPSTSSKAARLHITARRTPPFTIGLRAKKKIPGPLHRKNAIRKDWWL